VPADRQWEEPFLPRIAELVFRQAAIHGPSTAVVDRGERYTYADIADLAAGYACALLADGVEPGSVVGILMDNRVEWIAAYFGVLAAGSVVLPLTTWQTTPELAHVLKRSRATAVIVACDSNLELFDRVVAARTPPASLPRLRRIITVGDTPTGSAGAIGLDAFLAAGRRASGTLDELRALWRRRDRHDLAQVMFTSGSTASPKAVQVLGRAIVRSAVHTGQRHGFGATDSMYLAIPLFFVYGLNNGFLSTFAHGGSTSLHSRFDPTGAMQIIQRDRCTAYYGMAAMNIAIVEHPDRSLYDLSSLRKGLLGDRGPDHLRLVAHELGLSEVNTAYGLTETCGNLSISTFSDPEDQRLTSHGRPLPTVEARIVDPSSGRVLGPGEPGEIRVRGYNVTPGYLRDPKMTQAAFDEHGFFRTGDIGVLAEDASLTFLERSTQTIKTNGINVSPAEVEQVLQSHPAVSQAYVTGVPEPAGGQTVGAVFSTAAGMERLDPAELLAFARERLSKFKLPRVLIEVHPEDVPRTATGKVSLPDLRALLEGTRGSPGGG
jgi:fatty-acyl-CoA synthase